MFTVELGDTIIQHKKQYSINEVKSTEEPNITYENKYYPDSLFVCAMIDIDVPKKDAIDRHEFLHWLKINIKTDAQGKLDINTGDTLRNWSGNFSKIPTENHLLKKDDFSGDTIMEYMPPRPPKGYGLHRYYVCLYKQENKLNMNRMDTFKRDTFDMLEFINCICEKNLSKRQRKKSINQNITCVESIMFMTQNV